MQIAILTMAYKGAKPSIQIKSGMSFHLAICLFGQRNTWCQIKFPCLRMLRLIPFTQILEFTCNQKKINSRAYLLILVPQVWKVHTKQKKEEKNSKPPLSCFIFYCLKAHICLFIYFSRLFISFFTNIYFPFSIFLGPDLKPGMDTEENRWNHYNEFVFIRHQ